MRHPSVAKLGGARGKVYIQLMRSPLFTSSWLPLFAAGLMWAPGAGAQVFSADYGLVGPAAPAASDATSLSTPVSLGSVRIGPAFQADTEYSGAGLSLAAGRNWFAQVSVGSSLQQPAGLNGVAAGDALRIGGGYRFGDGQSLSLHVTGARGPDRLGLSVSYDWPRYFVRLSYDAGINPVPQDRLRFSAGVRF